jgi:hypothetical protein
MIVALFGVGVLTGDDEEAEEPASQTPELAQVAERVERIRRLEFERIPPARTISAEDAREEGLAVLDKEYPPARRAADERILTLLGLLPQGSDLRELAGTVLGEEVAGFYDPRTGEMTLVAGAGGGTAGEITLAHELTHALEDQHFGLEAESGLDDERTARAALHEGTATVAMIDYSARYLTGGLADRRQLLAQLRLTDLFESDSDLPQYLQRSLLFPYSAGARFVDAIGTWSNANRALRGAPPVSTEQVLHPAKYAAGERPVPVRIRRPQGPGWRRVAGGTIGEFDTAQLIRTSDSAVRADRAAAGWGGGRYVLWRSRRQSPRWRLDLAWRWDTRRDAAEFAAALPRYAERTLSGRSVNVAAGDTVRLTISPGR